MKLLTLNNINIYNTKDHNYIMVFLLQYVIFRCLFELFLAADDIYLTFSIKYAIFNKKKK